ncbi:pectate lyase [uncultured Mucilaginibacter sp.]|uniref:pectate lyase family protein n=1 Tax=uncultured Mucilaginibacter sp. TaxID=797541 RepID=UPI0025E2611B|nr:pectate lyase [uncultured Mucilaginibacter sp.]
MKTLFFVALLALGALHLSSFKAKPVDANVPDSALVAFPGAEGFGKYTTGGRGGKIAEVTNLNDSGAGSFRDALNAYPNEPLTVVFKVGGIIDLKSEIKVSRSNLTIAGQTAPGDGICLKGNSFILNGRGKNGNIIIRYLRSRPGGKVASGLYGLDMENMSNVIIDHCSFSWANEECAAMYDIKNVTVQWCIVSEGLYNAGHLKGKRSYGGVWGGQHVTYHHNLISNNFSRTVRFNGARAHDTVAVIDYRNNVIYNWGRTGSCYGGDIKIPGGRSEINMVNNYYKPGPATQGFKKIFCEALYEKGTGQWYINGNTMEGDAALTADNNTGLDLNRVPQEKRAAVILNAPFPVEKTTTQTAPDAYKLVLQKAGAMLPKRDVVDARIVSEVKNNNPKGMGSLQKAGIIDDATSVGGWPAYQTGKTLTDSDHDGIPDGWELANGLDKNNAADGNKLHKSGYTMLEVYLNSIK